LYIHTHYISHYSSLLYYISFFNSKHSKCINLNLIILNNTRYHQTIPAEVPVLDTKATYGLVSPIDFQMPLLNSIWNLDMYRTLINIVAAKEEKEQTLPPIKEEAIHQSSKEPKNTSGCILQ